MTDAYDFVAIGSGPAGESAAELAAFFGHRSAVIEKARPGGTVTTTGGVPTKTLREAALYFSGLCEGDVYGLRIAAPRGDRHRHHPQADLGRLRSSAKGNSGEHRQEQRRLHSKGSVALSRTAPSLVAGSDGQERKLRAKAMLIATGSRPHRPKNISFDIPGVCDTDTILYRGRRPQATS